MTNEQQKLLGQIRKKQLEYAKLFLQYKEEITELRDQFHQLNNEENKCTNTHPMQIHNK